MRVEDFIKLKIEEKGYTVKSFSEEIGIPYTTLISMLKSGIHKSSIGNVLKVGKGLGINISTLINEYYEQNEEDIERKIKLKTIEAKNNNFIVEQGEIDEILYLYDMENDDFEEMMMVQKFLEIDFRKYRIKLNKNTKKSKSIPLLGTIAAGSPILAVENIDNYFSIDDKVDADFALTIKGDSMINANIFDGDIVFIKSQPTLENGQIGAILIDDEATLKRFTKTNGTVILQAENPKTEGYPKVFTNGNLKILGKYVGLYRDEG